GRPHELAPAGDRIVPLEDPDEHRSRRHELLQVREERPLAVDRVETPGLLVGELRQSARDDRETAGFDHGEDLPEDALGHGVGLYDEERPFGHGISFLSFRNCAIVVPISAGLGAMRAPASASAAIFSTAVPLPPEMMAPAWPMRLPGGAVCPAMNAATGFFTCCLTNSAARSSAVPPISPIIRIASVCGSS